MDNVEAGVELVRQVTEKLNAPTQVWILHNDSKGGHLISVHASFEGAMSEFEALLFVDNLDPSSHEAALARMRIKWAYNDDNLESYTVNKSVLLP